MESKTERNNCYKCHKKINESQQETDTICLDCHGKMIQKIRLELEIKGACCDCNGTEYWVLE
jgi:DNA-directed RNA polymerase subunit RPC12/RpoP